MATKYWWGKYPGAEGDYSNANNWIPVNVPGAGDTVILRESDQSVTEGLDQSAVAVTNFQVEESYSGNIGSALAPLLLNCTDDISYMGSGDAFLTTSSSQPDTLLVKMPASSTGTLHTVSGTFGGSKEILEAYLFRGRWEHHSGDIASMYITHVSNVASDAYMTLHAGNITAAYVYAGTLEMIGGDITVSQSAGSVIIHNGDADDPNIYGGTMDWRTTNTAGTVNVYGSATFTVQNDDRAKAIGNVYAYGTPTLLLDNRNVTYTAVYSVGDPTIVWPSDLRTITIA